MTPAPAIYTHPSSLSPVVSKSAPSRLSARETEEILCEIRCLAADLVQQFKGGHPGTAIGAASIGMALWSNAMRYNPANPLWANRDRFVLSAGHACLLQYTFLHLAGYEAWPMEMLKRYHSPDFQTSLAAGHPEIDPATGIEVTTGPLGQGIANSVGLAIASKHMAAHYNRPGFDVVSNTIWSFTGDGCLQEGVGQEALSLAGHLALDNLILIYDCNKVTVDGNIDTCCSEDTTAKLRSMAWNVIEVNEAGSYDVEGISRAFDEARAHRSSPTCVKINTVIGYGSDKANTGTVHGTALGPDGVRGLKEHFGRNPDEQFVLTKRTYDAFAHIKPRGQQLEAEWAKLVAAYSAEYPELATEFSSRNLCGSSDADQDGLTGGLPSQWTDLLPPKSQLPTSPVPTRKASGIAVEALAPKFPQFMVGSADLLESTFVSWKGMVEFQDPKSGLPGDYSGRQIRYGIREHAMAAVANGLAAYSSHGFVPIISTFFMFFLYAAPATRMAALQRLRVIGVATHDSIGIGEDGPTHQPIALSSLFRAMPNLLFMRPGDAEEVLGCWQIALKAARTPSILSLSRQPVPLLPGSSREGVARGGYVVHEAGVAEGAGPIVTLVATGGEVATAVAAAEKLADLGVRVVSMPCMSLFDAQPREYRLSTIPSTRSLTVGIEAWASLPWPRYTGASLSMHTFGHSGPQQQLFEMFGFHPDNVAAKVRGYVDSRRGPGGELKLPGVGEFEELLLGHVAGH